VIRSRLTHVLALVAVGLVTTPNAAKANESVLTCGGYQDHVFEASSAYGMATNDTCPSGDLSISASGFSYRKGQGAIWQAVAPRGLEIVGATVPSGDLYSTWVNSNTIKGYGGYFYWNAGQSKIAPQEPGASLGPFSSSYFGFLLDCDQSTCAPPPTADIAIYEISLDVSEASGPWLASNGGIWGASGWIRGDWNVNAWGNSPSGLCGINARFANQGLPGVTAPRDPSQWHQCGATPLDDVIRTASYGDGPEQVNISAWDAAGETVTYNRAVFVDNQTPSVSLSGPADAASTAGVQHVTATASAGPSGVKQILCAVDGGPRHAYPGRTAQIPVSGVGEHQVACVAQNNARDEAGNLGTSTLQRFAMKIGVPTVTAVGFSKVVDGLECTKHTAHARARRGHRTSRPGSVTKCHVRTARREVTVWSTVHRHGHAIRVRERKVVRVVLEPHRILKTRQLVGHGRATTIHGWLGTATGTALADQTVDVLTAPDNGRGAYRLAAVATTRADGSWSARLRPGPSRLVTASFAGGPNTEGSLASPVHVVVPAKVELLRVSPRSVPWGGTVTLVGQLKGGYLPSGGALVRLRIGLGGAFTTYGVHEHVAGSGRFTTTYTFGAGQASVHRSYWFQIASLPMGNYPYAPASSQRVTVNVGG
jgi:hypothetical protein